MGQHHSTHAASGHTDVGGLHGHAQGEREIEKVPVVRCSFTVGKAQRQRVGIARALYANPTLLVLDEATSALDNETERRITETIRSLHGKVTTVVVAHRLSTVRHCDEVVFLENGRVAARGTFEQVVSASEAFAHLVALGRL